MVVNIIGIGVDLFAIGKADSEEEIIQSICGLLVDLIFMGFDVAENKQSSCLDIESYARQAESHKAMAEHDLINAANEYIKGGKENIDVKKWEFTWLGYLLGDTTLVGKYY